MEYNSTTLTLNNLIAGCIKGKRESQKALYDQYAPLVFSICLNSSSTRFEAEEMLVEVFLAVFKELPLYAGTISFEQWLVELAEHVRTKAVSKDEKLLLA